MSPLALRALAALASLVVAFVCGYQIADWRITARVTTEALATAQTAFAGYKEKVDERDALAARLAASDADHIKELRKAQNETNRLRARDASGALGLRVDAACPAIPEPAAPDRAGVDSGAGAELAPAARQAYFALREGIDLAGRQLAACQDELRARTSVGGNKSRLPSAVAASPQE